MKNALPLQEQIIYERHTTALTMVIMVRGAMMSPLYFCQSFHFLC